MRFRVLSLVLLVAISSAHIHGQEPAIETPAPQKAEPFGLSFGMSESAVKVLVGTLTGEAPGLRAAGRVPRPNQNFTIYMLGISPTVGLCRIVALSPEIPINDFGDPIKARFQQVSDQLTARYGKSFTYSDALRTGSIWNDPNDWAMALAKDERELSRRWFRPAGFSDLVAIALQAEGVSRNSARLALIYEGPQVSTCTAEARKTDSGGL